MSMPFAGLKSSETHFIREDTHPGSPRLKFTRLIRPRGRVRQSVTGTLGVCEHTEGHGGMGPHEA